MQKPFLNLKILHILTSINGPSINKLLVFEGHREGVVVLVPIYMTTAIHSGLYLFPSSVTMTMNSLVITRFHCW